MLPGRHHLTPVLAQCSNLSVSAACEADKLVQLATPAVQLVDLCFGAALM